MPADHNPAPYSWETMTDDEKEEAGEILHRSGHLFRIRQIVWNEGKPLNDNHRRQLDAAFDELEVRR